MFLFQPLTQFEITLYSEYVYINFTNFSFLIYMIFYFYEQIFIHPLSCSILEYQLKTFFDTDPTFFSIFKFVYFYIMTIIISKIFLNLSFLIQNVFYYFLAFPEYERIFLPKNDDFYFDSLWYDASINKFHVTVFFIVFLFLVFFSFFFKNMKMYKLSWNFILFELLEIFLTNTISQQLGVKRGQYYSVFLKSVFYLILLSNIFGLVPFSFTITSHLIFTFSLSLSILLGITIFGFLIQGINFLKLLVPGGAPKFLLPLLVPIELISYIARCFSLSIRLFANMMSGHTLLNILSGFVLKIYNNGFLFFSSIPLFVVMAVLVLEIGIAFLQAYVFLVLICIYLKDAFILEH
jgi:ATP synthase subunit 6